MTRDLAIREDFYEDRSNMDELLAELHRFGYPYVHCSKDGWNVNVNVIVTPVGVNFEVKSDYRMRTPLAAAQQCYRRLKTAIQELTKDGVEIRRIK